MMQTWTVRRDDDRDLQFAGKQIAAVSSQWRGGEQQTRWTELELYLTQGGSYVCAEIGLSRWQGEHNFYRAIVADTVGRVVEFFGHGWLAKELYADAKIDTAETID